MKIIVDTRSLNSAQFSGVETYTINLLEELLTIDVQNKYVFFSNSFKKQDAQKHLALNAQMIHTSWPSKILNLLIKLFGWPDSRRLIGEADVIFLPNLNFIAPSPGVKLVVTVHDLSPLLSPELYDWKRRVWHWLLNFRKIIKRADCILAVSEFTKLSLVKELGVNPNKIVVTPLGRPKPLNRAQDLFTRENLRDVRNLYLLPIRYFVVVSTLEPRKNLDNILTAFENLDSDIHLVIIGKYGWKAQPILEKVRSSAKRHMIHHIGYVSEKDKPKIIHLAEALIMATQYEGFGLPILEAFSYGTPVITSNISSLAEVAGDSAILINPYNPKEILDAMKLIILEPELRQVLIKRGKERVEQFSWRDTAEKTFSAITSLRAT